jgi:hypothetical protein
LSLNSLSANVSGQTAPLAPEVYVTFDGNYLGYEGNSAQFGNQDRVPSFMFWTGDPKAYLDAAGNLVWKSRNIDGSLPT